MGFLEPAIHEPPRPAKGAAIHTLIHGDSKPFPKSDCKGTLFLSNIAREECLRI